MKPSDRNEVAAVDKTKTECLACNYQRDLANRADHAKVVAIQERDAARAELEGLREGIGLPRLQPRPHRV